MVKSKTSMLHPRLMPADEFRDVLIELSVSQNELAKLLDTGVRTVRRWAQIGPTGPASAALRAWIKLHRCGLVWHPDRVQLDHFNGPLTNAEARRRISPHLYE